MDLHKDVEKIAALVESFVKLAKKKWMQEAVEKPGALREQLGTPEGKPIPMSLLKKKKRELQQKGEGDKKLSAKDRKLLQRINLAITFKEQGKKKKS